MKKKLDNKNKHIDSVDRIITSWEKVEPAFDFSSTQIIGRIMRFAYYIEKIQTKALEKHNITVGEFDVIATLMRMGSPYSTTVKDIRNSMIVVSSGALTNRFSRLENKDLIKRSMCSEDRRIIWVSLTKKGFDVCNNAIVDILEVEREIISTIEKEKRPEIVKILKESLISLKKMI